MKTFKCLITLLAFAASTAVWGQQSDGSQKEFDGYFECRAIAENAAQHLLPSQELTGSTCYLLGVNYGIMFRGSGFYDRFEQINLSKLLTGMEDGIKLGEPSNPYGIDQEWAEQFEISPYDMNDHLNGHINKHQAGYEISTATSDSTCYLLGVNYGFMFKGNGFFNDIKEINIAEFISGLNIAMEVGEPEMTHTIDSAWVDNFKVSPYQMNEIFNKYLECRNGYTTELNAKTGEYFLIVNAKREGVKETESGLQYILHSEGTGEKVSPTDTVVVNYKGYLLDGSEFDANENVELIANVVIEGFTEGLGLIGEGGNITLFIPSHMAYGEKGVTNAIEPNSLLVFEIELISIKKN